MDFCRDVLFPKISSDKPSVDGGEVSNLITTQHGSSNSGFICEGFVRTPADVNIEFPIPIDLACIVLNIEVGSRRSRGVSILARLETNSVYESSTSSVTSNLPTITKNSSLYRSLSDSLITKQKDIVKKDDSFVCLGKWFTNKESVIVLKNFHYKHSLSFSLPSFKNDAKTYTGTLRHPNRSSIIAVKELIIRILSVSPTGSPVLRGINIWGQPSMNLHSSLKDKFIQLWIKNCVNGNNQIKDKSNPSSLAVEYNTAIQNVYHCENTTDSELSLSDEPIPEDFLDSLTYEVMTVPILLPSGNSVDMHSLEKFFANEAIWSRSPSDPFTGIVFKEGYTPEPNVPLKSRIDRFLLLSKNRNVNVTYYTVGSSLDNKIGGRGRKRSGDKIEDECSSTKLQKHKHGRTMSLTNTSSTLAHPSTSFGGRCSSSKGSKNSTTALPPRAPTATDTIEPGPICDQFRKRVTTWCEPSRRIEKVMANVEKSQRETPNGRKFITITEDKRKKMLNMIEEGLKLKERRLGVTSDEVPAEEDTQSLKKIRLHKPIKYQHVATNSENVEHPPKHEPVTTKSEPKTKCNICIYYGKENVTFNNEYYKCLDCKSYPVLCSLNHFDLWHSVTHNWLAIPSLNSNPRPSLQCAVCKKFTRFHCPVCRPPVGFCSSQHFNEGHEKL